MNENSGSRTRWWTLFALTSINILNYIDRNIVSALVPAIQNDLHFSDLQMGLIGSGFIFSYTIAAPLFGAIGDRGPRLRTMAFGVFVWSGATAWSGIARTFVSQFSTRIAVGFGEAAYTAISPSVIADHFSRAQRGRVFAIYSCAIPVGSALGYVLGGLLEPRVGWQKSFFVVGIPGLLIALLMLFMKDPPRGQREDLVAAAGAEAVRKMTLKETYRRLFGNGSFMFTVLGYAAYTFVVGGLAFWMPTYITRYFEGVSLERANLVFGGVTVVGGFVGTIVGGWLADFFERHHGNGYMKVSVLSMILTVPLFVAVISIRDFNHFAILLFVMEVAMFMCISPLDAAVMNCVRPELRASATATTIFLIHALGDGISRILMGGFSDTHGLRTAMELLPWVLALAGILWSFGMIGWFLPMSWPQGALRLPRYQAHRGYRPRADVRENTLEAFRLAKASGAEMVECDVQLSADRKVVIFHDEDLQRLGGSADLVRHLSAADLKSRTQAPLLEDLLLDSQSPRLVNIEIKSSEFLGRSGLEDAVAAVVQQCGAGDRVLFSSFNPFALRRMAKLASEVPRALLVTEEKNPRNRIYLRRLWFGFLARAHLVHPDQAMMSSTRMRRFNDRGLSVAVWTVNDEQRARELESQGAVSVITDRLYARRG